MNPVPCPQGLTLARYEIRFRAGAEGVILPTYKGTTFRGGFAETFRRLVCATGAAKCKKCPLKHNCPYPLVFESEPPPGSEALRSFDTVPRPFVLEPSPEGKTFYNPGETFDFALILFGKVRNLLPYFIVTLEEFSRRGIGKGRRPFTLEEITAVNPLTGVIAVVYRGEDRLVRPRDLSVTAEDLWNRAADCPGDGLRKVELHFSTPTRITYQGETIRTPEFHAVIRNLLRRISSLCYFYHGFAYEADFPGIIRGRQGGAAGPGRNRLGHHRALLQPPEAADPPGRFYRQSGIRRAAGGIPSPAPAGGTDPRGQRGRSSVRGSFHYAFLRTDFQTDHWLQCALLH